MTVAGVLLAAGSGSRFGGATHKLLADFRGRPVVSWALDSIRAAGFNEVFVVVGNVDLSEVLPDDVTVVHCETWEQGQSQTLLAGVAAAELAGHNSVVVGLGDQPLVPPSAWRSVGASRGEIVAANFAGKRRPPTKLEQSVWPLLPTDGDEGARVLVRNRPDLVSEVPCSGNPADIDTEEDLSRWS